MVLEATGIRYRSGKAANQNLESCVERQLYQAQFSDKRMFTVVSHCSFTE
jgi:hypothetical protein